MRRKEKETGSEWKREKSRTGEEETRRTGEGEEKQSPAAAINDYSRS